MVQNDFSSIFICILEDLAEPISYLPAGLLIGMAAAIIYSRLILRGNPKKAGLLWVFTAYLYAAANTVYFSREPGSREGIDWMFLESWGASPSSKAFVIENVLLTIPLGLLLPLLWRPCRKIWICVGIGFLAGVGIELLQLITKRGYCQADDVWTNTLGAFLGWCIWRLACAVFEKQSADTFRLP